jgi:hypothetical protein
VAGAGHPPSFGSAINSFLHSQLRSACFSLSEFKTLLDAYSRHTVSQRLDSPIKPLFPSAKVSIWKKLNFPFKELFINV